MKLLMAIPVIGWFLGIMISLFISIPFYFLWNWLAPIYFYFLPQVYKELPFFNCIGLFILIPIVIKTISPFGTYVTQNQKENK